MRTKFTTLFGILLLFIGLGACQDDPKPKPKPKPSPIATQPPTGSQPGDQSQVKYKVNSNFLNVYTHKNRPVEQQLFKGFQAALNREVRVTQHDSETLFRLLTNEGTSSKADLIIMDDITRLWRLGMTGLSRSLSNMMVKNRIDSRYYGGSGTWYAMTKDPVVFVYNSKATSKKPTHYMNLINDSYKGRIAVASRKAPVSQLIVAGQIADVGNEQTTNWLGGVVSNLAIPPLDSEAEVLEAVVNGKAQIGLVSASTYYQWKASSNQPGEGAGIEILFPKNSKGHTFINITGMCLGQYTKNSGNAVRLMDYLTQEEAQTALTAATYQYPVYNKVTPAKALLATSKWQESTIPLESLAEKNQKALQMMNETGWK